MSTEDSFSGAERYELLRRLSFEASRLQKEAFGKGPGSTKSYLLDDLLLIVMRGGLTTAEKTLLRFEQADAVRQFRQIYENVMGDTMIGLVEEASGRRVVTYQSQIMFDPDVVVEIFVFDNTVEGEFMTAASEDVEDLPE